MSGPRAVAPSRTTDPVLRIGPYRVAQEIGSGGMSVVYKSVQDSLARPVAIKVLRPEIAAQAHLVERFDREALSLAKLQHENILQIFDYRTDDALPYMVTEFLEGVDLYDILERHQKVPHDVAAIVGLHVARAIDFAHARGVVHRDVKPANIMFTVSGVIKLMDFGIARQEEFGDLTQAGAGVGTPAYMSPEQILGEKLDGRTDIWSLGVVLYQMITGHKPFVQDDERTVLHKIRVDRPVPPRQQDGTVPRELERIVLKCLEKSPDDRYPLAQQLALALERFLAARLVMPHELRLVAWLQSLGELSAAQVEAALPPGSERSLQGQWRPDPSRGGRPIFGIPPVGWVAGISAVLFLTLLVVVLANWPNQSNRGSPPPAATRAGGAGAGDGSGGGSAHLRVALPEQGGLRVLAHPWAHVVVAGTRKETTPFVTPVPLAEGDHEVRLDHPTLGKRTRRVTITAGRVSTLEVDLTVPEARPRARTAAPREATRPTARAASKPRPVRAAAPRDPAAPGRRR